jgi:hypothetical protein
MARYQLKPPFPVMPPFSCGRFGVDKADCIFFETVEVATAIRVFEIAAKELTG